MRTLSQMITLDKERRLATQEIMLKPQISSALREQKAETQKRHVQRFEKDLLIREKKAKEGQLRLVDRERELELKQKELDEWEASILKKEQLLEQTKIQFQASSASSAQLDVPAEPSLPLNHNQVQHAVPNQKQTPLSSQKKNHLKPPGRERSSTGRNYLDESPKVDEVRHDSARRKIGTSQSRDAILDKQSRDRANTYTQPNPIYRSNENFSAAQKLPPSTSNLSSRRPSQHEAEGRNYTRELSG